MKNIVLTASILILSAISCFSIKPELTAREHELFKASIHYRVFGQNREAYQILRSNDLDRETKLVDLFNSSLRYEKLNAAQALAYLGNDIGVEVLRDAAGFKKPAGLYMTSSCHEISEAAACLLILKDEFPEDFSFSRIPNSIFPEFDVFLKMHNQQVDPIVTTPVDKVEAQSTQGHP